jgi:arylsulfatase A-like enzyme
LAVSGKVNASPPDIVIVVLDCVRAPGAFPAEVSSPPTPFISRLASSSVSFPYTVSPAPWTLPAHASLFTGLYPWEHGVHNKSKLVLDPGRPTLASTLRERGYSTFSASANGLVRPESGLLHGFESAAWGEWWEKSLPLAGRTEPYHGYNCGPVSSPPTGMPTAIGAMEIGAQRLAPRFRDLAARVATRIRRPNGRFEPIVSPWIESTFDRWLAGRTPSDPIFAFFNFYEAHEPYFLPEVLRSSPDLKRQFLSLRMDRAGLLRGVWSPSQEEYRFLLRLYEETFRILDRRVQNIVDALVRSRRWKNTVFVLTSDHGQAFGEHGFLFHEFRLWDPVVRIPLQVRFPGDLRGGAAAVGWASLVDIAPTLLRRAGVEQEEGAREFGLEELIDSPRPEPVWSVGDGSVDRRTLEGLCGRERAEYWDRELVAGYVGPRKLLLDVPSDTVRSFDLPSDPAETTDRSRDSAAHSSDLLSEARQHGSELVHARASLREAELVDHLRSWGYV